MIKRWPLRTVLPGVVIGIVIGVGRALFPLAQLIAFLAGATAAFAVAAGMILLAAADRLPGMKK